MKHRQRQENTAFCRYSPCPHRNDSTANAALANIARQERRRKYTAHIQPAVRVWIAPECRPAEREVKPGIHEKRG